MRNVVAISFAISGTKQMKIVVKGYKFCASFAVGARCVVFTFSDENSKKT